MVVREKFRKMKISVASDLQVNLGKRHVKVSIDSLFVAIVI